MPAMRSSWRECTTLHSPMWKTTVGESSFTVRDQRYMAKRVSFVLLICNLNINLLDRPSSLATLAEFFLVGFTLIVLSISSCSWSTSGHTCCKQNAFSTTEMKLTQHACYAEQLKRMYCTSFSNVNNYSWREKLYCPRSTLFRVWLRWLSFSW
jgi:hypothetical protein